MPIFLSIPLELRWHIYEIYLDQHRQLVQGRQPDNEHIRFLQTCKQVLAEATPVLWQYVSLSSHSQFVKFYHCVAIGRVIWADVANDGRISLVGDDLRSPVGMLHACLHRMRSLKRIRVFDLHRGLPAPYLSIQRHFEEAMFPRKYSSLHTYELFVDPNSRVSLFSFIRPQSLQTLRLTGHCYVEGRCTTPNLRHLTLHTVTGNYFDIRRLDEVFRDARFESFIHVQGNRMGFEICGFHLQSLFASCSQLRKLVLLGCRKLPSDTLASFLQELTLLEYFAISFVTVDELRGNFISALPLTVSTAKIQVMPAEYTARLYDEEQILYESVEVNLLSRAPPPKAVYVMFASDSWTENNREQRWKETAHRAKITLRIGPWESEESDTV